MQTQLRAASSVDRGWWPAFLAALECQRHTGCPAVAPGRLDEQTACVAGPGFGDRSLPAFAATGVLGRDEPEIARELLGVRERADVTDLSDQADRGQRVHATQAPQPCDRCWPRALGGLLEDQGVQPVSPCEQHLVVSEILAEDDLQQRLREANLAQPLQVTLSPCLTRSRPDHAVTQK